MINVIFFIVLKLDGEKSSGQGVKSLICFRLNGIPQKVFICFAPIYKKKGTVCPKALIFALTTYL